MLINKYIRFLTGIAALYLISSFNLVHADHGSCLDFSGTINTRFQISSNQVELRVARIACVTGHGSSISGSARLRLIASPDNTAAGPAHILGTTFIGRINVGQFLTNIDRTVTFARPPDGTYYLFMILEEFSTSGCNTVDNYCVVDEVGFGQRTFDTPPPPPQPQPLPTSSSCLDLGPAGFQTSSNRVRLSVVRIECLAGHGSSISGSARLQLIASPDNTAAGPAHILGTTSIGRINAGQFFTNFERTVAYTRPPAGTYYLFMILEEFSTSDCNSVDNYCIVDEVDFGQRTFSTPPPSASSNEPSSSGGGAVSWWSLLALFGMLTSLHIRPKQVKIN